MRGNSNHGDFDRWVLREQLANDSVASSRQPGHSFVHGNSFDWCAVRGSVRSNSASRRRDDCRGRQRVLLGLADHHSHGSVHFRAVELRVR